MPIYFLLLFVVSFYFVVCEKNKKKILEQYQAEAQHCSSLSLPAPHGPLAFQPTAARTPETPPPRSPAPLSLALVPLTAGPHCPIALARRLLPPHAKSRRRRRNPDLLGITNPLAPFSKHPPLYIPPAPRPIPPQSPFREPPPPSQLLAGAERPRRAIAAPPLASDHLELHRVDPRAALARPHPPETSVDFPDHRRPPHRRCPSRRRRRPRGTSPESSPPSDSISTL